MANIAVDTGAPRGTTRAIILIGSGLLGLALLAALGRLSVTPGPITLSRYVPAAWLALHLACVVPAVPLGAYVLLRRKGDARHRMLGRLWGVLMIGAALSSFALTGVRGGSLSPIHILSLAVLIAIPRAVWNARRGNIAGHQRSMKTLYFSLLAAGIFAFLPGRLLAQWLLG
jgi:uncharacterized membrane protein